MAAHFDESCEFCKIIKGKLPSSIIYQDDKAMAFLDINPQRPGHTLVIMKNHVELISGMHPDDAAYLFRITHKVIGILKSKNAVFISKITPKVSSDFTVDAVNVFVSDGKAAGQEVPHVHVHLVPRQMGDGLKMGFIKKS